MNSSRYESSPICGNLWLEFLDEGLQVSTSCFGWRIHLRKVNSKRIMYCLRMIKVIWKQWWIWFCSIYRKNGVAISGAFIATPFFCLFPKYWRLVCDLYLRKIGICVSGLRVVSYLRTIAFLGGTKVLLPEHKSALTSAQKCPSLGTLQTWWDKKICLMFCSLISFL